MKHGMGYGHLAYSACMAHGFIRMGRILDLDGNGIPLQFKANGIVILTCWIYCSITLWIRFLLLLPADRCLGWKICP